MVTKKGILFCYHWKYPYAMLCIPHGNYHGHLNGKHMSIRNLVNMYKNINIFFSTKPSLQTKCHFKPSKWQVSNLSTINFLGCCFRYLIFVKHFIHFFYKMQWYQPSSPTRSHQSSASLAFVWGIHRGPVNSPHKWPVTWKMLPFDDVTMGLVWSDLFERYFCALEPITRKFHYHCSSFVLRVWIISHIQTEAKWPRFRRRHFQTHFLECKCENFD